MKIALISGEVDTGDEWADYEFIYEEISLDKYREDYPDCNEEFYVEQLFRDWIGIPDDVYDHLPEQDDAFEYVVRVEIVDDPATQEHRPFMYSGPDDQQWTIPQEYHRGGILVAQ